MDGREQDARDLLTTDASSGGDNLQSRLSELEKLPIMLVRCSFNNTYVNIQDHTGRLLTWLSAVSAKSIVSGKRACNQQNVEACLAFLEEAFTKEGGFSLIH